MTDNDLDLVDVLSGFTNFVQNERNRSYNNGLDDGIAMEREHCAKIADNEITPLMKGEGNEVAKVIGSYIRSGGKPDQ